MQQREDGGATLSKQDLSELNKAYQKLYETLDRMPTFLGDYCKDRDEYLNIVKWRCRLQGERFRPEDWE